MDKSGCSKLTMLAFDCTPSIDKEDILGAASLPEFPLSPTSNTPRLLLPVDCPVGDEGGEPEPEPGSTVERFRSRTRFRTELPPTAAPLVSADTDSDARSADFRVEGVGVTDTDAPLGERGE